MSGHILKAVAVVVALLLGVACSDDGTSESSEGAGGDRPASRGDWPLLGRDLANSRATDEDETTVGPDNVDQLEPAWELADVVGVTGTPIVSRGVVYVGDWTGNVRALDAETGEERWATDVESYYIGGAVALDDTHVFVGTFDARVVALDRETGEPAWEAPIGDHPEAVVFGSPVYVDGLVVAGVGSFQVFTAGATPDFRGHVVALDAETGDEVWRYWTTEANPTTDGAGVSVWSSPAVDPESQRVYVGTGQGYGPVPSLRSDALVALDLRTGEEQWFRQFTVGDMWTLNGVHGADADVGAPPNLFRVGDIDAVGVADKAGTYWVLDRETGEELWSQKLTEGSEQGGVLAGAAVAQGAIYVASNRAGTNADLLALDQQTGEIRWQVDVGGLVAGPVSWSNGVVYVADNTGRISAFDAESGERRWSYEVSAPPAMGGISVVDGTVYGGFGGWMFFQPRELPKGGMIAFRLGGGADSPDDDSDDDEAGADLGEEVYQARCASCHGGDGQGASGPSMEGVADRLSLDEHLEIVREGRGQMPAWEDTLSEEELDAVVDYERTVLSGSQ